MAGADLLVRGVRAVGKAAPALKNIKPQAAKELIAGFKGAVGLKNAAQAAEVAEGAATASKAANLGTKAGKLVDKGAKLARAKVDRTVALARRVGFDPIGAIHDPDVQKAALGTLKHAAIRKGAVIGSAGVVGGQIGDGDEPAKPEGAAAKTKPEEKEDAPLEVKPTSILRVPDMPEDTKK